MPSPVHDPEEEFEEPPQLRNLRLLVTILTSVLIFGMLAMVAIFVIRLGVFTEPAAQKPIAAERFVLPDGAEITSLGRGVSTVLIATEGPDGEVLFVFDAETGALISSTPILRE